MGLNVEELKKKAESQNEGGASMFWEPETGKRNVIRFLPRSLKYMTKDGDTDFAYTYYVHWRLFDVEGWKRIICKQTAGQKCPICDYGASLPDQKKAKIYKKSVQHLYNVLDLADGKVKVYQTGAYIYGELLKFIVDPSWGDSMFDLKAGRNVVILKEEVPASQVGQKNPYAVKPVPDRTDVTAQLPDKWDEMIDSLQTRLPKVGDDAYYLQVAEHLRKGTFPAPIVKEPYDPNKSSQQAQPVAQAQPVQHQDAAPAPSTPTASATTKPVCFSIEYSPRLEKCKNCPVKGECRDAALSL